MREKTFELGVKLRGERFVVRNDERGLVHVFDDVGDGERLAGTGDAEQRLVLRAGQNAVGQLRNGLRLVAGGFERRNEFEHALKVGWQWEAVNAGFGIALGVNLPKLPSRKP